MTLGTKPLTSKPGEFYARCSLMRWQPEKRLTPEERREAREKERPRRFNRDAERGKGRIEIGFPSCQGFETTDKAAFEEHMKTVHGKKPSNGENAGLSKRARGRWRGPRLTEEGTPFKAIDELVRTCACGLVAEVRPESYASVQWWNEHISFCTRRGAA